jgi:hypothetical protein
MESLTLFILYLLAFIGLLAVCRLVYDFSRLYFELQSQKRYARPHGQ